MDHHRLLHPQDLLVRSYIRLYDFFFVRPILHYYFTGSGPPPPPPPPGGPPRAPGIPPMPLPPPGGANARPLLRKPVIKPKSAMRPLYWTRIQVPANHDKSTDNQDLWEDLEETPIDVDDFDSLFSRPQVQPKAKKEKTKKNDEQAQKVTAAKLLDPKRSQNVGIFIKSKHLEIHELENCIYNFDNSVIDFETLGQVKANQATSDEIVMIKGHIESAADIPLDIPVRYDLILDLILRFHGKILILTFFRNNFFWTYPAFPTSTRGLNVSCFKADLPTA